MQNKMNALLYVVQAAARLGPAFSGSVFNQRAVRRCLQLAIKEMEKPRGAFPAATDSWAPKPHSERAE